MKEENEFKELPNLTGHMCFACSSRNTYGLQMKFFTDGRRLRSWIKVPVHLCGWENVAHGGVITTIVDEIMGRTCLYLLKKAPMTRTISVDFLLPAPIGEELMAEGQVVEVRSRHEALVDSGLFDEKGRTCARARGSFALMGLDAIERMGLTDKEFVKSMKMFMT